MLVSENFWCVMRLFRREYDTGFSCERCEIRFKMGFKISPCKFTCFRLLFEDDTLLSNNLIAFLVLDLKQGNIFLKIFLKGLAGTPLASLAIVSFV